MASSSEYALRLAQRVLPRPAVTGLHTSSQTPQAVLPVTSCADDGSDGTLRQVLSIAGEGDTIDLSGLTCGTITLTQGKLDISALGDHPVYDLTLQGPGHGALAIDGNGGRVLSAGAFEVGLGTLTIADLTIRNGVSTAGLAACIRTSGNVVLERVVIDDCHASGGNPLTFGGALDVSGDLTLVDSTLSGSSSSAAGDAVADGGGAYVAGDVVLTRSVVSGNSVTSEAAGDGRHYLAAGGGLYVRSALDAEYSTIADNQATSPTGQAVIGGGIFVRGDATVAASTISGNSAYDGSGGGIFKGVFSNYGDPGSSLALTDSTLAGNAAVTGGAVATQRPLTATGTTIAFNAATAGAGGIAVVTTGEPYAVAGLTLDSTIAADSGDGIGGATDDLASDAPVTVGGAHDLIMAASAAVTPPPETLVDDPLLQPLADNGGPTLTLSLATGSPALDAGSNPTARDYDQRGPGFPRLCGTSPDIGAFEACATVDDVIFFDGFDGGATPTP